MGESNLVEYGEYDVNAAAEESKTVERETGSEFLTIKAQKQRHRLRIVPPPKGKKSPFLVVFLHYIKVDDETIVVTCPQKTPPKGERRKCPVCKEAERLAKSGNPVDRKAAWNLKPKLRVYANTVRKLKGGDVDSEVKVWGFGKQIYDQLRDIREDIEEPIDFTHPIDGFDIMLKRTGSGARDTEYDVKLDRRESQLAPTNDEMNELILEQHDLEKKYATLPSDDELYAALDGERPEKRQVSSGGGNNKRLRGDNRKKRQRTMNDDYDDDDDDIVDAEFDEDDV